MRVAEITAACISGLILSGMIIWIGIALHLARYQAERLKQSFVNSPLVRMNVPSSSDSIRVQLWCIGSIASCITFPSAHIKQGRLSSEDLGNLPRPLKLKLQIMHWTSLGLIAALMAVYLVGKYGFDL